jgi:hypothetical protein
MRVGETALREMIRALGLQEDEIPTTPSLRHDYITWTCLANHISRARLCIEERLKAIQSREQLLQYNYRIIKDSQAQMSDSGTQTDSTDSRENDEEDEEDLRIQLPNSPASQNSNSSMDLAETP